MNWKWSQLSLFFHGLSARLTNYRQWGFLSWALSRLPIESIYKFGFSAKLTFRALTGSQNMNLS
jgi:hypothetical protein